MAKKLQKNKELTIEQENKLALWEEKIKNGEAIKELISILKNSTLNYHPEAKFEHIIKDIIPKTRYFNQKLSKKECEEFSDAMKDYGIDNDMSVIFFANQEHRGLIINLRRELIKEYKCETYSEKALVDLATNAYARNLLYSKKMLGLKDPEFVSSERNGFMSFLSKEVDRANRHFITALETLIQIKRPELKVNVKTNTAFIAQNQQINANQNKQDETNEAK